VELEGISVEELQLATRNHGMPLEALRWDVTPVGLHYLLTHYDIPAVDEREYTLAVDGLVARPASLTLDDLRALPAHEVVSTMECAGNGRAKLDPRPVSQPWLQEAIGTGRWRGARLRDVLARAEPGRSATEALFTGLDRGVEGGEPQAYQRSVPLELALDDDVLLAYELNGAPLPPQHGFPLRLLVPGWYGMTNVKWLAAITLVDEPFAGYQQSHGYRLRQTEDEVGTPVERMLPRALMLPPGVPEFLTRGRTLAAGKHTLEGRAWSGQAPVAAVDVSVDGGVSWQPAALDPELGRWAWRRWTYTWHAAPGVHVLMCRARDASGASQPLEPRWNLGGYANNAVQRLPVVVT
jgi:DMSO/TMAO reductase YedYZ molybdopterin-dependent catalytic subunit